MNPANGNPMVGGIGGVDTEGNLYATDSSDDSWMEVSSSESSFFSSDDDWMSDSFSDSSSMDDF